MAYEFRIKLTPEQQQAVTNAIREAVNGKTGEPIILDGVIADIRPIQPKHAEG